MKIIIWGMGLNEKALAAMDKTEPHGALNACVKPRYPQIRVSYLEPPDVVIPHTIIFG
jgi:hypothetical protein